MKYYVTNIITLQWNTIQYLLLNAILLYNDTFPSIYAILSKVKRDMRLVKHGSPVTCTPTRCNVFKALQRISRCYDNVSNVRSLKLRGDVCRARVNPGSPVIHNFTVRETFHCPLLYIPPPRVCLDEVSLVSRFSMKRLEFVSWNPSTNRPPIGRDSRQLGVVKKPHWWRRRDRRFMAVKLYR